MLLDYIEWLDENGENGGNETPPPEESNNNSNENNTDSKEVDVKKVEQEAYARGQKELRRELSKTIGTNLFDENEVKAFVESLKNKVDKTELEKQQARLETLEKTEKEYNDVKLENVLIKSNVNETYLERAKQLVKTDVDTKGVTLEEATQNIIKEMPFFVGKSTRQAGYDHNSNPENMSDADKYIQDKYKDNPYYKPVKK